MRKKKKTERLLLPWHTLSSSHFNSGPNFCWAHTPPLPGLHEAGNTAYSGGPRPGNVSWPSILSSLCLVHAPFFQISFGSLIETSQAMRWARAMPMTQMRSSIRRSPERRLSMALGEGVHGERSGRHIVPSKTVILTSVCKGDIYPFAAMI